MRILSVRQPWACALFAPHPDAGVKPVEHRTWGTPYRGLVAIHSSAKYDARQDTVQWQLAEETYDAAPERLRQYSAVLGVVRLVDCHASRPGCCGSPWAAYGLRINHLVLADATPFAEPIGGVKGTLGLRAPADALHAEILHRMGVSR